MKTELSTGKRKRCFVIGPIGKPKSPERTAADWVLKAIIRPVVAGPPFNYEVKRADEFNEPGLITEQVITWIIDADLVIADLTGHNPNAFYELAIRHMARKPIIHMYKDGEELPFDVREHRALPYSLNEHEDLENAKRALLEQLKSILDESFRVSNPITVARALHPERLPVSIKDNAEILFETLDILYTPMAMISAEAAKLRGKTGTPTKETMQAADFPQQDSSNWNWNLMCYVLANRMADTALPDIDRFVNKQKMTSALLEGLVNDGLGHHSVLQVQKIFNTLFSDVPKVRDDIKAFCDIADNLRDGPPRDPKKARDTAADFDIYLRKTESNANDHRIDIFHCKEVILYGLLEMCGI